MGKYIDYVNIKQGSDSVKRFSNGNTLPLVQVPFGFNAFAPQTDSGSDPWYYHPKSRSFEGIRMTHQPSPWIGEHGAFVMLPQLEKPYAEPDKRWSGIDFSGTELKPHYMRYSLFRSRSTIELTPSCYGAAVRLSFASDLPRYISMLSAKCECGFRLVKEKNMLFGYSTRNDLPSGTADDFKTYFVIKFDDGAVDFENTVVEQGSVYENGAEISGENAGIHIALRPHKTSFTLAASYISEEQALANLNRENITDFDTQKAECEKLWESYLERVKIKTNDEKMMKTFYSCLYRAFLYPHKAYEPDVNGNPVHYAPGHSEPVSGYRYTDNGFWDTYRTVYPFFALAAKDEYKEMLAAYVQDYKDAGWLPCWTALDAKNCMPSTLIDAVFADAAVKGFMDGELLEKAFEGMEKHANNASEYAFYGREGCGEYLKYGYVPRDMYKESVNLTLDAAYGDYCLSVIAEILGKEDKQKKYAERAKNYRNIFDRESGFMRGRDTNGGMADNFDPASWGEEYTEASAWQTTFAVQHDIEGLSELYRGKKGLELKLDEFFLTAPIFRVGGYKQEIHEMTEMCAGHWGLCAISNQPSFHIPYIYAAIGARDKADYWVERLAKEAFSFEDDGFPGDEDNGTMAIWYLFAVLGLYPLCPGKPEYVKTKMLADEAEIMGKRWDNTKFGTFIPYNEI